ncbi:MAG: M20/M25/M40 family metallo-hydrolase [Acetomicrobium sp.]
MDDEVPIARKLKEVASAKLGLSLQTGAFKSWSDAEPYVTAGIPAIVFGPGKLSISHTPFEHISLGEMDVASRILTAFLASLTDISRDELNISRVR